MTKNFDKKEFECGCGCGLDTISPTIVLLCQMVRDKFKNPITITSGIRCKTHNKNVGGSPRSQHLLGYAADIVVKDTSTKDVADYINSIFPNSLGIGQYKTFVHIDMRMDRAYRW